MATISLQAAYDQARSFLEVNKVEQAIGVAQHILEYFPENLEAHRILGEAYLAGRQFDLAEVAFGRVLHSDPENIPAHVGLGITYERQGKLDRAVGEFEQALEVRPDMPELRSQLLRLYTEVWGAEGATLRLSRPGLARLYAKGHMLPQAIQEFRSVIDESPDRFDAHVGLAESLWRDGQTEVAAETCEGILAERADVLKANLLLGYIRQAAGDASGEPFWRFAQQLEPYQQVARALFEVMPDLPPPDLEIPPWDEQAWYAQRAREDAERQSHAHVAAAAIASAPTVGHDADFLSGWGDEHGDLQLIQPAAPVGTGDNDDFLSSLLALSSPINDGSGVELDASSGVTPFNFDDLSGAGSAAPAAVPAEPELTPFSLAELGLSEDEIALLSSDEEPTAPAEPELTPFSLAELGLSEDEIALLSSDEEPTAPAEPELTPFSLADLGLSEDEIALLSSDEEPTAPAEPELTPFSLADFGLSEDEIALLSSDEEPTAPAEPELTPFSLADLGLSEDEITLFSPDTAPVPSASAPDSQILPFSLADLGLSSDEIVQLNAASDLAQSQTQPEPFSFDDSFDLSADDGAGFGAPTASGASAAPDRPSDTASLSPFDWSVGDDSVQLEGVDFSGDNSDLQPFSLDDLDLNSVDDYGMLGGALPPSLQPFSMDDSQPPASPREMPMPTLDSDDSSESGGYSWQQPVAKPRTDFLRPETSAEPAAGSIFSKLKHRASEQPKEELPPLPPVSVDDADLAGYFSNDADDVPLHEESASPSERFTSGFRLPKEGAPPAPAASPAPALDAEPELTPFSLEDLGLSPEEIALLNGAVAAPPAADAEPELTPFSLEDLGLSPEEIALLIGDVAAPPAANAEPELTPFSLEDLGLSPEEIAMLSGGVAAPPAADAEPELTPFSLEDLGLSPEEIAMLSGGVAEPPPPATGDTIVPGWSQGEEPELTPFSLEDLGLSPEEIASLGQMTSGAPAAQPDESIDSDMFDFDLTDTSAMAESPATDMLGGEVEPFSLDDFDFDSGDSATGAESPTLDESVADVEPFSFDDFGAGDADTALPGDRRNRELSLTDDELAGLDLGKYESLIGGVGGIPSPTPVAEPDVVTGDLVLDRLIMLGQRHGFVDLTDIISVVGDPEAEAERIEEIGWTLHRAGIEIRDGDEVIDMEESEAEAEDSGNVEFAPPAAASPAVLPALSDAEPDMTPFSLEELGLSPEEIAALGLSEEASPAPASGAEPELTPFSLEDLGLSPDEIAMLGAAAESAAAPLAPAPASDTEPDMTPFSLEELGLTPEEIALLSGSAVPEPAPAEPVAPAPPAEPALVPFSLEELGLSPEEIAALGLSEDVSAPAASGDDLFSFDVAEARPVEKAVRTAPRVEAPLPPPPTEDTSFTPEPLDNLDNIWDVPTPVAPAAAASVPSPREKASPPARQKRDDAARVVTPPLGEREKPSRGERREVPAHPRDDDRSTRREVPARSYDDRSTRREVPVRSYDDRSTRREVPARSYDDLYARREDLATRSRDDRSGRRDYGRSALPSRAARENFDSFVPTGDEVLDEYLIQLQAEPDNYGMALALARVCAQTGRADLMAYTYKHLIRGSHALDMITEEVQELIGAIDDQAVEQQLYRVLGDAFSKLGRLRDAMAAYNHNFGG